MDGRILQNVEADGTWNVKLQSNIDESVDFPNVPAQTDTIEIDLGDVSYINSTGIRNWVKWFKDVNTKVPQQNITISRIPLSFIRAASLIEEVLPHAHQAQSLYVNYFCPSCSKEDSELVVKANGAAIPNKNCPDCGERMEIELPFENYARLLNK